MTTTAKNTKHVASRIQSLLGKKYVDILILSHFHGDHFGKYGSNGIWYLMEKAGFTFGKFLRRDVGSYKGSALANCNKKTMTWNVVGEMADSMLQFVCYATSSAVKTKLSKIGVLAYRCNKTQIKPPDANVSVTILARDGMGVKDESGKKLNRNTLNNGKTTKIGENDFSICIRLQFEKFVYATCGDLSGSIYQEPTFKYHDTETRVAPMMGEVDVYKVNHHGASASSNSKWCKTLKPTVSVIACGNGSNLPHSSTLNRLKGVGSKIYTTGDDCNKANMNKVGGIEMGDDVVITVPKGGKTFTVASPTGKNKKTYNIKQNKVAATKCVAPA